MIKLLSELTALMSCPCDAVESKGHKLLILGFCNDKEVIGETEIGDSI